MPGDAKDRPSVIVETGVSGVGTGAEMDESEVGNGEGPVAVNEMDSVQQQDPALESQGDGEVMLDVANPGHDHGENTDYVMPPFPMGAQLK